MSYIKNNIFIFAKNYNLALISKILITNKQNVIIINTNYQQE